MFKDDDIDWLVERRQHYWKASSGRTPNAQMHMSYA